MTTNSLRYFIDAEFIEDGESIDLISIALVCEDGREFYAVNRECEFKNASTWVLKNVLNPMGLDKSGLSHNPGSPYISPTYRETHLASDTKERIAQKIIAFIKHEVEQKRKEEGRIEEASFWTNEELYKIEPARKPVFWGEWCAYDWVAFAQLFGSMIDLPKGFPMRCSDVIQWAEDHLGIPPEDLPPSLETEGKHHALLGARTVKARYDFLVEASKAKAA